MANQYSNEGSGPSNISEETSDSTVEINVKTLESQIYSFQVEKNVRFSLPFSLLFLKYSLHILQNKQSNGF